MTSTTNKTDTSHRAIWRESTATARTSRRIVGVALLSALLITGCSPDKNTTVAPAPLASNGTGGDADPSIYVVVPSDDAINGAFGKGTAPSDAETHALEDVGSESTDTASVEKKALDDLYFAPDPNGTSEQIALRFLRKLQKHQDLAATGELAMMTRHYVSSEGPGMLHQLMNDVRRNAQLDAAGPCGSPRQLDRDSVSVRCGTTTVVVHVAYDNLWTGVQLSGWNTHDDVYPGHHTHAYTNIVDQ